MSDRASSGGRPDQRMDLLVLLDASGGTIVPTGYGHRVGVFSGFSPEGSPIAKDTDEGSLDYRCLRWHDLQKFTGLGIRDRRLSVQHQVDWPAPYTDVRPGDAPYAQPENFTALNRTTRWADSDGRVALPTSLTRLIGSEDQRDAVAIALRSPPLEAAEPASKNRGPATLAAGAAVPDGVAFRDASNQGSVTSSIPDRVAVNGVTYFGPAAVAAAKDAINRGGTAGDVARAALSAARGTPPPPFFEGTRERGAPPAQGPGGTRAREPEPETNPDGSVLLSDHPLAYVWSENGDRIGLAGTFFDPAGEALQYFAGREGTAIGALPMRHDAHVTMGPEMTGRIMFVPDDAAGLPDPTGKPIKGEMWRDSSRANLDTNIGLETCQWRPVIRVSAEDVGSVQPPPPWGKRDEEPKTKPDESRTPGGIIADGATQERKPDLVVAGDIPRQPGANSGQPAGGTPATPDNRLGGAGTPGPKQAGQDGHPEVMPTPGGVVVGGNKPTGPIDNTGFEGGITFGIPDAPGGKPRGGAPTGPIDTTGFEFDGPDVSAGGIGAPGAKPGRTPAGGGGGGPGDLGFGFGGKPSGGFGFTPQPQSGGLRQSEADARADFREAQRAKARQEALDAEAAAIKKLRDQADATRRGDSGTDTPPNPRKADAMDRAAARAEARHAKKVEKQKRREREREARRRRRRRRRLKQLGLDGPPPPPTTGTGYGNTTPTPAVVVAAGGEGANVGVVPGPGPSPGSPDKPDGKDCPCPPKPPTTGIPQGGVFIPTTPTTGGRPVTTGTPAPDPFGIGSESAALLERYTTENYRADARTQPGGANYVDPNYTRAADETLATPSFDPKNYTPTTATLPLMPLGAAGGASTVAGWATLATYAVNSLQVVAGGAFGGGSFLNASLSVVHKGNEACPCPEGSLLGQVINTPPGQNVQTNAAPLRVVGDIQAAPGSTVVAGGGGVLTVQRNHSGGGSIVDKRPAILIETNRAVDKAGLADHIATSSRRFNVGPTERVTASSLRALTAPGESGPAISVGAVNLATGEPSGGATWAVGKDGVMSLANTGTTPETPATGTGVKVYTTGDETYRVRPDGTVDAWGSGGANGSTFKDNAFSVVDNGDATKVLAFEVSGVSTGTTRTLTVPNASGTIPLLGSTQTWTGAQTFSSQAVTLAEIAAPSTPASGFGAVYVKTDGLLYFKNDAGTEHDLTATAAGGAATGDVKASLVAAAAVGWLECNGAAVSRTTYSALFAAIGTTFGPGDETTTFNLPDFRGRGLIGVGTGTGLTARTLGQQTIGAETVTLGSGEMPSHSHGVNISDSGHSHGVNDSGHTHANTSHSHGVTDPGHFHYITRNLGGGGGLAGVTWTTAVGLTNSVTALTLNSTTGISIDSATVSTPSATTGVTTQSGTTGITGSSNSTGGGGSHANMQPSAAVHWFVKT